MTIFKIEPPTVLELSGPDARKFLQGFTTQQLMDAHPDRPLETFITNLKGRCVAHGIVFDRLAIDSADESIYFLSLVPAASNLYETVFPQLDKYIIREDVSIENASEQWCWYVVDDQRTLPDDLLASVEWPILSGQTRLVAGQSDALKSALDGSALDPSAFESARITNGFPMHGVDFSEENLPQEIDRTEAAISFTKGCYLGQETIARLDALGQTQKELALLECASEIPAGFSKEEFANDELHLDASAPSETKPTGRITSWDPKSQRAIAMIRRPHFEPGNQLYARSSTGEPIELKTITN